MTSGLGSRTDCKNGVRHMPRAIAKTATYGAMHFTIAVIVAFLVTRSWVAALSVGVLEPFVQTFFYNIHEHLWSRSNGERAPAPSLAHC